MKTLTEAEKENIKNHLAEKLGLDLEEIKDDSTLENNLGADSLDKFEIAIDLEKFYNISIPDDEIESLETVTHLFECVEKYL